MASVPGTAARVAGTLMRAFPAMRREPQLADAMVRALTFADRSVGAEVHTVSRLTNLEAAPQPRHQARPAAEDGREPPLSRTPPRTGTVTA